MPGPTDGKGLSHTTIQIKTPMQEVVKGFNSAYIDIDEKRINLSDLIESPEHTKTRDEIIYLMHKNYDYDSWCFLRDAFYFGKDPTQERRNDLFKTYFQKEAVKAINVSSSVRKHLKEQDFNGALHLALNELFINLKNQFRHLKESTEEARKAIDKNPEIPPLAIGASKAALIYIVQCREELLVCFADLPEIESYWLLTDNERAVKEIRSAIELMNNYEQAIEQSLVPDKKQSAPQIKEDFTKNSELFLKKISKTITTLEEYLNKGNITIQKPCRLISKLIKDISNTLASISYESLLEANNNRPVATKALEKQSPAFNAVLPAAQPAGSSAPLSKLGPPVAKTVTTSKNSNTAPKTPEPVKKPNKKKVLQDGGNLVLKH